MGCGLFVYVDVVAWFNATLKWLRGAVWCRLVALLPGCGFVVDSVGFIVSFGMWVRLCGL